jgi:hypothetical protein
MPEKSKSSRTDLSASTSDATDDHFVSSVGPSATTPDHTPRPWQKLSVHAGRTNKFIIAGVVTAVALILGVGGWFAYALWYQNPDKVVLDAIINAVRSDTVSVEGTISSRAGQNVVDATVSGKYGHEQGASGSAKVKFEANDTKLDMNVDGVQTLDGTNYVRVKDIDKAYDLFDDALVEGAKVDVNSGGYLVLKEFLNSVLKPTVDKVNNKWVKFAPNDLKSINAQFSEQLECTQSVMKELKGDAVQLVELGLVYQNNNFLEVRKNLGTSGEYFRFEVGVVNEKFKDFAAALTKTRLYADIQACSPMSKNPLDLDVSKMKTTTDSANIEVWINQWNHEFHKISMNAEVMDDDGLKGTMAFSFMTTFNKPIEIAAPKDDVITFEDAFSDIREYISGLFQLGVSATQNKL